MKKVFKLTESKLVNRIKRLIKAISKNYKKEYPLKKDELDFFKNKWHPYTTVATWYMWRSIDPVPVEY